jgi:hypothetical protein
MFVALKFLFSIFDLQCSNFREQNLILPVQSQKKPTKFTFLKTKTKFGRQITLSSEALHNRQSEAISVFIDVFRRGGKSSTSNFGNTFKPKFNSLLNIDRAEV